MYMQNIGISSRNVNLSTSINSTSDNDLEVVVAGSLIEDVNSQLSDLSQHMQESLNQKNELNNQISFISEISTHPTKEINEETVIPLNLEEKNRLKELGVKEESFIIQEEKIYVKPEVLDNLIEEKNNKKSELNSMDEMTMLKVQSLVDQRKNMMMLLSNMMASNNETLSAIVRNIKN